MLTLYDHQIKALEETKNLNRCAYFLDMGLGKTFVGSEKMMSLGSRVNLVICQKSKVKDWIEHFNKYYPPHFMPFDLSNKKEFRDFVEGSQWVKSFILIGVINYELAWRRKELLKLHDFTLMLDESSLIQNPTAKRTKFILKLNPANVILLSGTPCSGKYENLWTQSHLIGWDISKKAYDETYVNWRKMYIGGGTQAIRVVDKREPYKNVDRLKQKLRDHGAVFMKTDECFNLPEQTIIDVKCDSTPAYKKFMKDSIVKLENEREIIGDTTLTKRLYSRMLASQWNRNKFDAFEELIQSTNDRLIVFYNFDYEFEVLEMIADANDRPTSVVNGKTKDLTAYENETNSITFVQYQAGAKGLNLQKANKLIWFSPTEKCEDYMQSMKRIHRIGQSQPCFYYRMIARGTIDESIYRALERGEDYTNKLFEEEDGYGN